MYIKATEKGQALVLIAIAAIGLFGFAALSIDGSRAYSDKRNAQNAADSAALAASLGYSRGFDDYLQSAEDRATSNGYDNGETSDVTIEVADIAAGSGVCPGNAAGKEFTVTIVSYVDTTFARVIGRDQVTNAVTATARGCSYTLGALFDGNAIVGLSPNPSSNCAVDTGNSNSKAWNVTGGGVFSNGCLQHPNGTLNIPDDKCITSVGNANTNGGGSHDCVLEGQSTAAYAYPTDVVAMMPPDPCTGTITSGRYAGGGKVPTSTQLTSDPAIFQNDIFCISDLDALDDKHVELTNATLYVTDQSFDMRFNGGGNSGFFGTASTSGTYQGYYMIIKMISTLTAANLAPANNCNQYFDFRGNGNLSTVGTILAPSTCVDYRGNSTGSSTRSQLIFYRFTGNGGSQITVDYRAGDNPTAPEDASISFLK